MKDGESCQNLLYTVSVRHTYCMWLVLKQMSEFSKLPRNVIHRN